VSDANNFIGLWSVLIKAFEPSCGWEYSNKQTWPCDVGGLGSDEDEDEAFERAREEKEGQERRQQTEEEKREADMSFDEWIHAQAVKGRCGDND